MSRDRPWMSGKFTVNDRTPVSDVIAYFTEAERLHDYTSQIEQATDISADPIQGGLADVYAVTLLDGTKVAVKRFRSKAGGDRKELKRTARELKAWSKLQHSYILNLLGLAQFRGRVSIVSPWMGNGTVIQYTRENVEADRYALCGELTNAVAYLHKMNVVHGDLKGANVLISASGHVKLSDFGLTIAQDDVMHLSTTNAYGGTLRWMAPELLTRSSPRSGMTDVWALGMTILEIITGQHPFSEIRSEAKIEEEVAKNGKTPARPDATLDQMEHGAILWRKLGLCWTHDPAYRITATALDSYFQLTHPAQSETFRFDEQTSPQEVLGFLTNRWGLTDWTPRLSVVPLDLVALGGLSDVYSYDAGVHGIVALKAARTFGSGDGRGNILEQQARELDTWSTFNHDNILDFLGVTIYENQLALVSPLMDHGNVPIFLQRHPDFDRYVFCKQLTNVIEYVHSVQVVHGDIKGANILVFEDHNIEDNNKRYQLKLTDFGTTVAREGIFHVVQMEEEGVGTLRWMAPELFTEEARLTPQTDVWAMGMTMLEIITGNIPYPECHHDYSVLKKVSQDRAIPQPLEDTSRRGNWLWMCLLRCWELEPADRLTAAGVNSMMAMLPPA